MKKINTIKKYSFQIPGIYISVCNINDIMDKSNKLIKQIYLLSLPSKL